tara:strand:- start:306 stop:446 length:141 start_codon:yes stop_codon:yes gene_type:complete
VRHIDILGKQDLLSKDSVVLPQIKPDFSFEMCGFELLAEVFVLKNG